MHTLKQLWRSITKETVDEVYERKMDAAINCLFETYKFNDYYRNSLRENLMAHKSEIDNETKSTSFFIGVINDDHDLIIDNFNIIDQIEFKLDSFMLKDVARTFGSKDDEKKLCLINAKYSSNNGYKFIFYVLDKYDSTAKKGNVCYKFDTDMNLCSTGTCSHAV